MGWITLIAALAPRIFDFIVAVEKIFGPGTGETKKQAVVGMTQAVIGGIQQVSTGGQKETIDALAEPIGKAVDGLVAIANAVGAFDALARATGGGSAANDV